LSAAGAQRLVQPLEDLWNVIDELRARQRVGDRNLRIATDALTPERQHRLAPRLQASGYCGKLRIELKGFGHYDLKRQSSYEDIGRDPQAAWMRDVRR
jgi:hypothetical protein